jgi:hypothetical protein
VARRAGQSAADGALKRKRTSPPTRSQKPAQRPARPARKPAQRHLARRVSWPRRIGVAAGLLLLVGGSIAFAAGSLNRHGDLRASEPPAAIDTDPPTEAPPTPDSLAPLIHLSQPSSDQTVYTASITLRGRTEPGATLDIVAEATGADIAADVQPDGRFDAIFPLAIGENWLTLKSQDAAGNSSRARVLFVRAESRALVNLSVSPTQMLLADLPASVEIVVSIEDDQGAMADGAQVTFSLSPPNQATTTYETTSTGGLASWPGLVIRGGAQAAGEWRVTVRAVLASGTELRDDATFSLQ